MMRFGPKDRLALIERYYRAYEDSDQPAIESVLHPDFTFTSPQDDGIDRRTYFQRCWPGHERIKSFHLLDMCADNDGALIRYRADVPGEPGFQCTEHFEFTGDHIVHIDVYFGRELA